MESKGALAAGMGAILAMIGLVITLLNSAIDKESDKRLEGDRQLHERLSGMEIRLTKQGEIMAAEVGKGNAEIAYFRQTLDSHSDILKSYFIGDTPTPARSYLINRDEEWAGDPHRERPPR